MHNYKIILQYDGSRYQGWQKQESTENTIQGKLETILSKMVDEKVEIQGAGRTDSGVHAMAQVANFHINSEMTAKEIMDYINLYLPEDIAVIQIDEVPERFHSRLNARGKVYRYRVLNSAIPNIFERKYVYQIPEKLDIIAMKRAAEYLCGTHDYKAFTAIKKTKKSTVRTIDEIAIEQIGDEIRFTFRGNGFLYHMVRILIGTILEVGTKEKKPEDIPLIIDSGLRENAGALAPAKGLCLMEVKF